jgi:uracil-DNA glycosylase
MIVTEEKFDTDLDSLLHEIKEIKEKEDKPIYSEPSRPIQAIRVIKEDQEDQNAQKEPGTQINFLFDTIPSSWKDTLQPFEAKLMEMSTTLESLTFFPLREQIWASFIPLDQIRVVILGQDPYPTHGNAHGLAFSTLSQSIPASLRNIYKELQSDMEYPIPVHGNLQKWVDQGVMLLNTILTVEEGAPLSHHKLGWNLITDHVIRVIAENTTGTVFVLWGKPAQTKEKLIPSGKHHILTAAHPSPLSAHRGFFGSKPFSQINAVVKGSAIDWKIE